MKFFQECMKMRRSACALRDNVKLTKVKMREALQGRGYPRGFFRGRRWHNAEQTKASMCAPGVSGTDPIRGEVL